jgi:hypothetical protein
MTRMAIHRRIAGALALVNLVILLHGFLKGNLISVEAYMASPFWFYFRIASLLLMGLYPITIIVRSMWLSRLTSTPLFAWSSIVMFFKAIALLAGAHNDGDHYFIEDDLKPTIEFISVAYMTGVAWIWQLGERSNTHCANAAAFHRPPRK